MLYSMRLRNLRSFSDKLDSPYIDLKPLTILVGKNSSGKSSFIRSLPLLRQSVEAKTTGPILWYGSYVDFGAFSEAKKNDCESNIIFFDFKIKFSPTRRFTRTIANLHYEMFNKFNMKELELDIEVEVGVAEVDKKTVAREILIKIHDFQYSLKFENNSKCSFYINGEQQLSSDQLTSLTFDEFLPRIYGFKKVTRVLGGEKVLHTVLDEDFIQDMYSKKLVGFLTKYCHPNTSQQTIINAVNQLNIDNKEKTYINLSDVFRNVPSFIKNLQSNEEVICETAYELSMHKSFSLILLSVNSELESTFNNVRYIAPLRATAERYYRHQDLQIEEIDHTGSNLAMLLKSLSRTDNIEFSNWTLENFGFKVRVEELGLHYALKIQTENDNREYNINDMGFGFSQILPIIASIWLETRASSKNKARVSGKQLIFAIEQPELHLHPEYQSRLARMFVSVIAAAKKRKTKLNIIFETHSKTMVDTVGDCIEDGMIESTDVNIALFQKELDESSTKINFSYFDRDGFLEQWPIGFFSGRN